MAEESGWIEPVTPVVIPFGVWKILSSYLSENKQYTLIICEHGGVILPDLSTCSQDLRNLCRNRGSSENVLPSTS